MARVEQAEIAGALERGEVREEVAHLQTFGVDFGAEVGDAGGVAGIGYGEGEGVFHPVVPDAVGIVGGGGDGVFLRAELAGETVGDADRLAGLYGAERVAFELRVGAVDFRADAGADHHADDGVFDGAVELDGDADRHLFAALDDEGRGAVGAERFDGDDFGAAVAAAEGGGEWRAGGFAPGAVAGGDVLEIAGADFAGIAFGVEAAVVDPPNFVGELMEEVEVVGGDEDGGAGAAEAFEAGEGAGLDERVAAGERVVEGEGGDGGELERVERAEVAGGGVETDFAGLGLGEAGGELEELVDARAILPNYADDSAIGSGDGNLL